MPEQVTTEIKHPTPHGGVLDALARNSKLPLSDRPKVQETNDRYKDWIAALQGATLSGDKCLAAMVKATNEYKKWVDFNLVFQSPNDFLYRQAGQLKLNSTILEEFLPYLVCEALVPGIRNIQNITVGPQSCYAGMFIGPIHAPIDDGAVFIKTKNQDFTVGRNLFVRACSRGDFESCLDMSFNVAYFVSEIKTNLDKTMFQEAAATARELKTSVGDAVYVLLCEWLDMPPIDTRVTDIDEVIILRKAKRLGSGVRAAFSKSSGRQAAAEAYEKHLSDNPLSVDAFARLVEKLNSSFPEQISLSETEVLKRGYF
jgi:hypothetical protein